jgi:hypothetical protein
MQNPDDRCVIGGFVSIPGMEVLINSRSMFSFIDFIFPYVYQNRRACVACWLHNIALIWF